jgi:hypothetical protein
MGGNYGYLDPRGRNDRNLPHTFFEWLDRRKMHGLPFGQWYRDSFLYWWPREWSYSLRLLAILLLLSMAPVIGFHALPTFTDGIVYEAEHRVWLLAPRAYAALHDQIRHVFDDQIWSQVMIEKLLMLALIAGVILHAVLSYREIKEWIDRSIDRLRDRHKELKNEKTYHFMAKAAGMTGAILITVQVYAIVIGGAAV